MADNNDDLLISVSTDLTTIKRQLRQLGQTITQETSGYSKSFEAAGKRMDSAINTSGVQRRINELTGVAQKSAKAWTGALAEQGKELDRLRTKFNPIYSAVKQYQASVAEIQTANRLGAISTDEMTAAIQRERQATLSSIAAIKQRNSAQRTSASSPNTFNTANIAAQFQDIGVTAAMGMNPLQIALQQGTQLSMVLEQMRGTGQSTGRALFNAFTSIISPISLVTIGVVAAGAALIEYFANTESKAKKLDDVLSDHAKAIADLRKAYGIAGDAADDFGRKSTAALESAARSSAAALRDAIKAEEKNVFSGLSDSGGFSGIGLLQRIGLLGGDDLHAVKLQFAAFSEPIEKLRQQIRAGKPDYDAFQQSLAAIVATDPQNLQPIADKIQLVISKAADGRGVLDSMADSLDQISTAQFDTARIVTQMGNIETAAKNAQGAAGEFLKMLAHIDQIASGIAPKGDRIGGKGAMDAAQQQYDAQLNLYRRFGYGEDSGIERKSTKSLPKPPRTHAPTKTADDRITQDIQAIQARTQALAQERGLLGATYEEQVKRNTEFDLETQALKQVREEARKKGDVDWQNAQLSDEQKAKIDAVSEAYARQADALKKAQDEMNFERDIVKGVLDDIHSALEDGKITTQEWGSIFLGVLDKIINKLEGDFIDALFAANNAGGGGGSLLGGIGKFLFGGGGGGAFPTAIGGTAPTGIFGGGLYADGGYTGTGGKNTPAGLVHKGEVVWSQNDIRRAGGVGIVEAMRRSGGGMPVPVSRGGNGAPNITYAPTIDARGADSGAVARIQQTLAQDKAEFSVRVVAAVQSAKKKNVKGI